MKKETEKTTNRNHKLKNPICLICWIIMPIAIITLIILDGIGLYSFNKERLLVMGICVIVILLPFLREVTIKDVSIKKDNDFKNNN